MARAALAKSAPSVQHGDVRSMFFSCLMAAAVLPACYTSHSATDGPSGSDASARDASVRDGAPRDVGVRDATTRDGRVVDAEPPPPPPDLIMEGCALICDVSVRCFGEPPSGSCIDDCAMVSMVLTSDVCAELWFELGQCVQDASCDVLMSGGPREICGPVAERLSAECGIDFGDGGMMGGGGSGSGSGGGGGRRGG